MSFSAFSPHHLVALIWDTDPQWQQRETSQVDRPQGAWLCRGLSVGHRLGHGQGQGMFGGEEGPAHRSPKTCRHAKRREAKEKWWTLPEILMTSDGLQTWTNRIHEDTTTNSPSVSRTTAVKTWSLTLVSSSLSSGPVKQTCRSQAGLAKLGG